MTLAAAQAWLLEALPALLARHRVPSAAVGVLPDGLVIAHALHGVHRVFGFTGRDPAGRATHLTTSRVFPRANLGI
ncbi:hypothetical protein ACFWQC_05300 [Nocardioides sp. NPDC058538]|uniref:hypothetical protein n=1 Tax=Nocardioides sp. NPDC058538 TaxID=3346542 RepID=UPI0036564810